MKADDWERQIHERLCRDDPVAPAELAETLYADLVAELSRRHPRLRNADAIRDAAADALMNYVQRPSQFDPTRRGLRGYLVMSADGDLKNAIERDSRIRLREEPHPDVELLSVARNDAVEEPDEAVEGVRAQALKQMMGMFSSEADRQMVTLMLAGERSTEAFAAVLGIGKLPELQRRREVKRHKDRLKKVIQRHLGASDDN